MVYSLIAEQNIDNFQDVKNNMEKAFLVMEDKIQSGLEEIKQECRINQKSFETTENEVAKLSVKIDQLVAVSKKTIETLEDNMIRKPMVHQPKQ